MFKENNTKEEQPMEDEETINIEDEELEEPKKGKVFGDPIVQVDF